MSSGSYDTLIFEPLAGHDLDLPGYANQFAAGFDIPICLKRPCFEIDRRESADSFTKPYVKQAFLPILIGNGHSGYSAGRELLSDAELKSWDYKDTSYSPTVVMRPDETIMFPTGLKCQFPHQHVMHIYPRSSTGLLMLMMSNNVAVIDSDYRGELFIVLWNRSNMHFKIQHGQAYAQGVIVQTKQLKVKKGQVAVDTERGEGGFGSTT